jgi:hypothetical protein
MSEAKSGTVDIASVWPGIALAASGLRAQPFRVIASEAKQSFLLQRKNGLLRRCAPRNDGKSPISQMRCTLFD